MVIIETISNLIRRGTLALRLTVNIIAGYLLTLLGNNGPSVRHSINPCTNSPANSGSSSGNHPIICYCNPKNIILYISQLMSTHENHPFHIVNKRPWQLAGAIGGMVTLVGLIKLFHQYDDSLLGFGTIIIVLTIIQWWRDVTQKYIQGRPKKLRKEN